MRELLSGALTTGFLVASLYFARFWKQSNDRLFLLFAVSFLLLGMNALALGLSTPQGDLRVVVYGLRLLAFLLLLYAIYDKNREKALLDAVETSDAPEPGLRARVPLCDGSVENGSGCPAPG